MSATGRLALALAPSSSRSRPSPRREVRGAVRSRAVAGEPSSSPRSSRTVAARRRADAGDSCADGAPRGHEDWRVYVRSLTGLGRRAALMATVGGMSLGLRGEERSSAASVPGDEMSQQHQSDDGDDPSASAARADASEGAIASAPEADPWEGAYVKPALTVPEYIAEVRAPTPPPIARPASPRISKSAPERPRALATESTCCSECFHCQTNIAAPLALRARRSRRSAGRPSRRSATWRTA